MAHKTILICGAGFGGLTVAKHLSKNKPKDLDIVLIDENKFHEYVPSVPELVSGNVKKEKIRIDLQKFCKKRSIEFKNQSLKGLDQKKKIIETNKEKINYDYLVLALGSETFFPEQKIKSHVLEIKNIVDAEKIRERIIESFKKAEIMNNANNKEKIKDILRFVIVGGGLTGVELSCEIMDVIKELSKEYKLSKDLCECILIESGNRVLKTFPESMQKYAMNFLEKKGVKVLTGSKTKEIEKNHLLVESKKIKTNCIIWCTGVRPKEVLKTLSLPIDERGALKVDKFLKVSENIEDSEYSISNSHNPRKSTLNSLEKKSYSKSSIFGLGDCTSFEKSQIPVVWNAQTAILQATLVAENIRKLIGGKELKPFVPKHLPTLISLGKHHALFNYKKIYIENYLIALLKKLVERKHMLEFR